MNKKIEKLWNEYLKLVNLTEGTMHPQQLIETKRAFYGACGQLLVFMRDDIGSLDENEGADVLQSMFNEVGDFWNSQSKRNN